MQIDENGQEDSRSESSLTQKLNNAMLDFDATSPTQAHEESDHALNATKMSMRSFDPGPYFYGVIPPDLVFALKG